MKNIHKLETDKKKTETLLFPFFFFFYVYTYLCKFYKAIK